MTTIFHNYMLNVLIAFIILLVGNFFVFAGNTAYYTYAPINWFYTSNGMLAEDVCLGDTVQTITSYRTIHPDVSGYPSDVVKELFLVERGVQTKVYDEASTPFVEKVDTPSITRIQQLPDYLTPGSYQWVLHITLFINGVERSDISLLTSNLFEVKVCE